MIHEGLLDIPRPLKGLRRAFVERGFDLRFVGGCVRDYLMGENPKDIDLCTDASPEEALDIYQTWGHDHYLTGFDHGTISVRAGDGLYEITSLREECDHDGRRALVRYTRDWLGDLSRRDLTINAMAMTFDGEIIDPFGGCEDLKHKRVRFVGEAQTRCEEDFLRILRFIRFQARFGGDTLDPDSANACAHCAPGLKQISGERIWQEMRPILLHRRGAQALRHMTELGLWRFIGIPGTPDVARYERAAQMIGYGVLPATLAVAALGEDWCRASDRWRWSKADRQLAAFLFEQGFEVEPSMTRAKYRIAVEGADREHVEQWAKMFGDDTLRRQIIDWRTPVFPLKGEDFMAAGFKGADIGRAVNGAKLAWAVSDYTATREQLLLAVNDVGATL